MEKFKCYDLGRLTAKTVKEKGINTYLSRVAMADGDISKGLVRTLRWTNLIEVLYVRRGYFLQSGSSVRFVQGNIDPYWRWQWARSGPHANIWMLRDFLGDDTMRCPTKCAGANESVASILHCQLDGLVM